MLGVLGFDRALRRGLPERIIDTTWPGLADDARLLGQTTDAVRLGQVNDAV